MKCLRPITDLMAWAFLCWARREINPLHPDLPRIVLRINELEARRAH